MQEVARWRARFKVEKIKTNMAARRLLRKSLFQPSFVRFLHYQLFFPSRTSLRQEISKEKRFFKPLCWKLNEEICDVHVAIDRTGQSKRQQEKQSSSCFLRNFNENFEAHDALEDVVALQKIIFKSPLQLSKEKIVNHSAAISISQAVDNLSYMDRRHERLQTFEGKLFSPEGSGIISQSMGQKIAGSGLQYSNLRDLYMTFGSKGLLAVLSMSPSCQSRSKQPRVTGNKRILAAILNHFQETIPREE